MGKSVTCVRNRCAVHLLGALRRLVDGDGRSGAGRLRHEAKASDELCWPAVSIAAKDISRLEVTQSVRGVQSPRRVIPALERRTRQGAFGDRNPSRVDSLFRVTSLLKKMGLTASSPLPRHLG